MPPPLPYLVRKKRALVSFKKYMPPPLLYLVRKRRRNILSKGEEGTYIF